jgi:hypothetical protein
MRCLQAAKHEFGLTHVAFRMLLMVLLTQNSVYMLMKRCCYTNGLLSIQDIRGSLAKQRTVDPRVTTDLTY